MPEGQLSVSHSPLLTEESVSTGLGSMLDEPNSNGAEFFSQMREESLLTTMMDVREFGDDQERDLMPPVLQNMTVLEEVASCAVKPLLLQEEVILDIELTERHSHIHLYHFTSSADAPIDPLFRMWDDVRDIMQQLNPSMCEIDYSVFEDIQDSCVWRAINKLQASDHNISTHFTLIVFCTYISVDYICSFATRIYQCIPTGGRRRSRQHFFYATRVNQTGSLRRILRRYFQNGDSRVNTREHGESKRWKNIYFVIINCIFCCNFQSLTFAVLGWCLRTLNSPSGYGHVHVQVFKVPPLYKRQLNAVQLVYSLFWGVLSFNVQGMSKMS
ncbi:hypothetical protein GQR58_016621 [Nymphon striatum]|nr:hypothetical protein GQR58_016621 [Nymphon striatum]